MADSTEETPKITFVVKSSADAKYNLTLPTTTTIADLKEKLSSSEYAAIEPSRQRLIYSGRVLKDPDTLATCKIKEGNTVHMVKGAESNSRQNPASQTGSSSVPPGAGNPAPNVPSNLAAGTGNNNPLAQLTGARYAGFHQLPGADMFGADGGMGAPPNPDQMLRMLEDPAFAQQMNEAMNNPAVIDMLRNNPMIRNNPAAQAAINNPELRRMMMDPQMIRMQMQMQRAMGGDQGGQGSFPMPGATDTTQQQGTEGGQNAEGQNANQPSSPPPLPNLFGGPPAGAGAGAGAGGATGGAQGNPFAALFGGQGGAGQNAGAEGGASQANPFGNLFGAGGAGVGGAGSQEGSQTNPIAQMTQQMMQNPQMMQQMMNMMGNGGGQGGAGGQGGFNPFAAMGGMGGQQQQQQQEAPQDNTPPEERYAAQLEQLNAMGFYEFERNVQALRRSGGSVQGAVEYLLSG